MDLDSDTIYENLLLNLEPECPAVEQAFRSLRLKLIKFFSWRRCEEPDSLADETISRLLKNVRAGQVLAANPYSYVYAIAAHVFHESLRERKRRILVTDLDEAIPPVQSTVDDCQRECLKKLPGEQLELLEAFYLDDEVREKLAQSHGVSLSVLRVQIHRLKYKFQLCYRDCIRQNRLPDGAKGVKE